MKNTTYKGKEPEEIYVVSSDEGYRIYIYIKQAFRWLDQQMHKGNSPQLHTYIKRNEYEA